MPRIVDWPGRMKEVAEFVGLGPAELETIRATGPIVSEHAAVLTASVYDHFLEFPEARKFFLDDGRLGGRDTGRPEEAQLGALASRLDQLPDRRRLSHPAAGHGDSPQPPAVPPGPFGIDTQPVHGSDHFFHPNGSHHLASPRNDRPHRSNPGRHRLEQAPSSSNWIFCWRAICRKRPSRRKKGRPGDRGTHLQSNRPGHGVQHLARMQGVGVWIRRLRLPPRLGGG